MQSVNLAHLGKLACSQDRILLITLQFCWNRYWWWYILKITSIWIQRGQDSDLTTWSASSLTMGMKTMMLEKGDCIINEIWASRFLMIRYSNIPSQLHRKLKIDNIFNFYYFGCNTSIRTYPNEYLPLNETKVSSTLKVTHAASHFCISSLTK